MTRSTRQESSSRCGQEPRVGALRQKYGDGFAAGARSNTLLSTVLKREGVETLSQLLMKGSARRST